MVTKIHWDLTHILSSFLDDDDFFEGMDKSPVPVIGLRRGTPDIAKTFLDLDSVEEMEKCLENHVNWKKWKYSVQINVMVIQGKEEKLERLASEINLLHAAVIKRDIKKVKFITDFVERQGKKIDVDQLLNSEIRCINDENWKLSPKCSWISDAKVIHLAACWHLESLVHFLEVSPYSWNITTNESQFTPLHVAASMEDGMLATSVLIQKGANTEAKDDKGQRPLHIAAQLESIGNVVILLFNGNANVMAEDRIEETPLHKAKSSKILDILLNKTKAEKVNGFSNEKCLFSQILEKQPASIETYLDLMFSCNRLESDMKDKELKFHLDMFNHDTKKKSNFLDKHKEVIDAGYPEMLRHPVMMLFTELKWAPHRKWYYVNFFLFLAFLISFTFHGMWYIDFLQCYKNGEHSEGECFLEMYEKLVVICMHLF